jgi:prolyl-tRNA synthetase
MLDIYARLAEDDLAMPVIKGRKTASERFPGAVDTLCIESMMQDRKALQAGTSHFLGQNFAKASNIRFQSDREIEEFAWTTSWGASTRLIGGVIMTHGDDDGIILPPRVASAQVVLLPIFRRPEDRQQVMQYTAQLARDLKGVNYHHRPLTVEVDAREIGGARGWEWIKKGIPLRLEIGPRDIAQDSVFVARRDQKPSAKTAMPRQQFLNEVGTILDDIQKQLLSRARAHAEQHSHYLADKEAFYAFFTPLNAEKPEIHGGFAYAPWCGEEACEAKIKQDLNVTIRCIPFDVDKRKGTCICCGQPSSEAVVFAKAY